MSGGIGGRKKKELIHLLEANIDDMPGERFGYVMEGLFRLGALDVYYVPITMKKNRPGVVLSVLCRPGEEEALTKYLLRETTTWGVRRAVYGRTALVTQKRRVDTPYGPVEVKFARVGGWIKAAGEYVDCRALAQQRGVALDAVYREAMRAFSEE